MALIRNIMKRDYVSALWCKQIGQALASKFKVSVRKGKNWSADIEKGVLTYGPEIHFLNHNQALGILAHEIGHLRYTKHVSSTPENTAHPKLCHEAVNMLEDHRIEERMSEAFPGAREAINMMRESVHAKCEKGLLDYGVELKKNFDELADRMIENGIKPFQSISELQQCKASDSTQGLSDQERERLSYAKSGTWGEVPVVTQILLSASLMYHGRMPEGYPDPEVNAKAKIICEAMRKAKVEDLPSTQAISDFFHQELHPVMKDYYTHTEEKKVSRSKMRTSNEISDKEKDGYDAPSKSDQMRGMIEDLHEQGTGEKLKLGKGGQGSNSNDFNYEQTKGQVFAEIGGNLNDLRKVLKDKMFDRYGGRFLSGQLNSRKLYKHRLGDMRLFKRKVIDDKKDFSFMLAVDVSSSMRGARMVQAQKATVLLNEVLRECGVPVGIWGFGQNVTCAQKLGEDTNIAKIERLLTRLESNTELVEGIRQSAGMLKADGLTNKIHITITDGQVYSRDYQAVVELQHKHHDVHFYGIGMQTDLKGMFQEGRAFHLKDVEELLPTLIAILKQHIR